MSDTTQQISSNNFCHRKRHLVIFISAIWLCFFLLRLGGPPNLRDHDQERPASYVMDVVQNGNWICQRDYQNNIASKPPLYTWLAALTTIPFERISRFTLYLPNALAVLITAWIIFMVGSSVFGENTGFFAALFYIVSSPGLKQLCLARTDPLFTMFTALAAVLVYRAWIQGKGWTWFWLASAAATITKGPLGIVLATGGLFAYFWERKDGNRQSLVGNQLPSILLFLLITLGWFFMAYAKCGQEFIDKLLLNELVGHTVGIYKNKVPLIGFYKPTFYCLTRFFPWSILGFIGFWRILKRPSQDIGVRTAERFLFCYFFFGLLLFSLASHHRGDLIFPLLPAVSIVAGNVFAGLFQVRSSRLLFLCAGAMVATALIAAGIYYFVLRSQDDRVRSTYRLKDAAEYIDNTLNRDVRIEYVNTPYTLQFYLNTLRRLITPEEAARLMTKSEPIFIITLPTPEDTIKQYLADTPFYIVLQSKDVMILSNYPPPKSQCSPRMFDKYTLFSSWWMTNKS